MNNPLCRCGAETAKDTYYYKDSYFCWKCGRTYHSSGDEVRHMPSDAEIASAEKGYGVQKNSQKKKNKVKSSGYRPTYGYGG